MAVAIKLPHSLEMVDCRESGKPAGAGLVRRFPSTNSANRLALETPGGV